MQPLIWWVLRMLQPGPRRRRPGSVAALPTAAAPGLLRGRAATDRKSGFTISPRQLQRKFKHAAAMGVQGTWNQANGQRFMSALGSHVRDPDTVVVLGRYHRGQMDVIHFINPGTGRNVVTTRSGEFVSAWQLSPTRVQHVLEHGGL